MNSTVLDRHWSYFEIVSRVPGTTFEKVSALAAIASRPQPWRLAIRFGNEKRREADQAIELRQSQRSGVCGCQKYRDRARSCHGAARMNDQAAQ